jgi:hypothetical protein
MQSLQATGRGAEATRSAERARAVFERLAATDSLATYDLACIRALCADLIAWGKSDLTDEERVRRQRYAADAVATLRRCIEGGFGDLERIEHEKDFDAIRSRPDFRALLFDLAFPADPFARGR